MLPSPILSSNGVLNLVILTEGQHISPSIGVVSVDIVDGYNSIPRCLVSIEDGDMPNSTFPVSDSDVFKPGNAIVVQSGYGSEAITIFEGVVVRHGVRIPENGDSLLILECTSKALAMTVGRKRVDSQDKSDSDAITALLGKYNLTADVESTSSTDGNLVQSDCSDWDFLVALAKHNGQLVRVEGSIVKVAVPDLSAPTALKLTYGIDIIEFTADLDAGIQLNSAEATAWDPSKPAIDTKNIPSANSTGKGNLQAGDPSRTRGCVKFRGSALAKTGASIELVGVGDRFKGTVLVTGMHHEIRDGNWLTTAIFGMDPDRFTKRHRVEVVPCSPAG